MHAVLRGLGSLCRPFLRFPFLHFGSRSNPPSSPSQFKKLLAPGKIGQTLCLGNLTDRATYEYLRTIAPDLKIVKGRLDVEATSLPLTQVVTHGSIRVGFLEGFTLVSNEPDLLLAEANRLDVDVLCWGGTHRFECFEYMDKFFVNPGSATGAFTPDWPLEGEEVVPSFCLMDVRCCHCPGALSFFFYPEGDGGSAREKECVIANAV